MSYIICRQVVVVVVVVVVAEVCFVCLLVFFFSIAGLCKTLPTVRQRLKALVNLTTCFNILIDRQKLY